MRDVKRVDAHQNKDRCIANYLSRCIGSTLRRTLHRAWELVTILTRSSVEARVPHLPFHPATAKLTKLSHPSAAPRQAVLGSK